MSLYLWRIRTADPGWRIVFLICGRCFVRRIKRWDERADDAISSCGCREVFLQQKSDLSAVLPEHMIDDTETGVFDLPAVAFQTACAAHQINPPSFHIHPLIVYAFLKRDAFRLCVRQSAKRFE